MRDWRQAGKAAFSATRSARGIEITSREIRMVRLSCIDVGQAAEGSGNSGSHIDRTVYVDDVVRHPLPAGVVSGADIVDAEALASALSQCFALQAQRLAQRLSTFDDFADSAAAGVATGIAPQSAVPVDDAGGVALALCPSVVTQSVVALDELMPGFKMRLPCAIDDAAFDALEPWVMLHAQKISGLDLSDLVVDWYRVAPDDAYSVVVAAAQRHYLDVRHRVIETAGATLNALGDAAAAALGACRFVVARCLHVPIDERAAAQLYPSPVAGARFAPAILGDDSGGTMCASEAIRQVAEARLDYESHADASRAFEAQFSVQRFAAIWIGERAWRAWSFEANGASMTPIALPEAPDLDAMLRALGNAAPKPLALALVAGERERLEPGGGMRALGQALCCPVIEFDASSCCEGSAATPQGLGPAAAVAFGLALKELMR